MKLKYEFPTKYLGRSRDEEFYETTTYTYDVDVRAKDVLAYIKYCADQLEVNKDVKKAICLAWNLGLFDDIDKNTDFEEFMLDRYESKARKEFNRND